MHDLNTTNTETSVGGNASTNTLLLDVSSTKPHAKRKSLSASPASFARMLLSQLKQSSAALAIGLISTQANATVLFEDDFNRANSANIGSEWSVNEAQASDVAIYRNELRLRDYLPHGSNSTTMLTSALFAVDASAFNSVNVTFDWRVLSSTEISDTLVFGIAGTQGTLSQTLFTASLETAGSFSEDISINGLSSLTLGFWLNVNSHTESIYLDNIMAVGTSPFLSAPNPASPPTLSNPPTHSVSESSSLALMLIGVAGLTARKRHTGKAELTHKG